MLNPFLNKIAIQYDLVPKEAQRNYKNENLAGWNCKVGLGRDIENPLFCNDDMSRDLLSQKYGEKVKYLRAGGAALEPVLFVRDVGIPDALTPKIKNRILSFS